MRTLGYNTHVRGWLVIIIPALSFLFYAFSTGITGKTLKNGNGCECHSAVPFSEVSVVINGPDTLAPGEQALYTLTMTGGDLIRGGTNIAASNGLLLPFSSDLRFEADELTHVEPKMPESGMVTFQFWYTAPGVPGTETIYANGNSVNFNGNNTGDKWNFADNKTIQVISAPATFPLTVNIVNGWNMVSIPGLHPDNQNVSTWWINKDPGAGVFRFNAGYQSVSAAEPGRGYWMKHIGAQTYNTGEEWPSGILTVAHTPIAAASGWNLIGGYEETVPVANITTTPPGLISGSIFKYNSGYQAATAIEPGYGYWVKLSAAGQINFPSGSEALQKKLNNIPDNTGRIIITDNNGNSYSLYAAAEGTDLEMFELPPLPPDGMFDVRYSTQRNTEVLNGKKVSIDLSGAVYPLKIKSEGLLLKFSDGSGSQLQLLNDNEEFVIETEVNKLFVEESSVPEIFSLEQNYPNPFNPVTSINFSLPEKSENVSLIIYNSLGQKTAILVNSPLEAGVHQYSWNADNSASGIYFYQIITEKFTSTKKMLLLK